MLCWTEPWPEAQVLRAMMQLQRTICPILPICTICTETAAAFFMFCTVAMHTSISLFIFGQKMFQMIWKWNDKENLTKFLLGLCLWIIAGPVSELLLHMKCSCSAFLKAGILQVLSFLAAFIMNDAEITCMPEEHTFVADTQNSWTVGRQWIIV